MKCFILITSKLVAVEYLLPIKSKLVQTFCDYKKAPREVLTIMILNSKLVIYKTTSDHSDSSPSSVTTRASGNKFLD